MDLESIILANYREWAHGAESLEDTKLAKKMIIDSYMNLSKGLNGEVPSKIITDYVKHYCGRAPIYYPEEVIRKNTFSVPGGHYIIRLFDFEFTTDIRIERKVQKRDNHRNYSVTWDRAGNIIYTWDKFPDHLVYEINKMQDRVVKCLGHEFKEAVKEKGKSNNFIGQLFCRYIDED